MQAHYNQMKEVTKSKFITTITRNRLVKAYVWSILLYGCQSWAIDRGIERRINAAEIIWFLSGKFTMPKDLKKKHV